MSSSRQKKPSRSDGDARRSRRPASHARSSAAAPPRAGAQAVAAEAAEPAPRAQYHHGDLRHALIEATEALLAERGADGFSLREVARRAGVSPSAPAHHFGDAAGLLAAVSTIGFEELAAALRAGEARGGADPARRLAGQGLAYIECALRRPERFRLMFRSGRLEPQAALLQHANAAFGVLQQGVTAMLGPHADAAEQRRATLAMWALVHGYAHLAIAGKLDAMLGDMPRARWLKEVVAPALAQVTAAFAQRPESAR